MPEDWNGEVVRGAFAIDTRDREVMAWVATAGAGVSGEMVRDMMLGGVEHRFDAVRAPAPPRASTAEPGQRRRFGQDAEVCWSPLGPVG